VHLSTAAAATGMVPTYHPTTAATEWQALLIET
jgi:hypothetical protein